MKKAELQKKVNKFLKEYHSRLLLKHSGNTIQGKIVKLKDCEEVSVIHLITKKGTLYTHRNSMYPKTYQFNFQSGETNWRQDMLDYGENGEIQVINVDTLLGKNIDKEQLVFESEDKFHSNRNNPYY